jgi:hypothetical protein
MHRFYKPEAVEVVKTGNGKLKMTGDGPLATLEIKYF